MRVVYVLDRVRIHYPELVQRAPWIGDLFFRAEEQVRESAMVPYAIAMGASPGNAPRGFIAT